METLELLTHTRICIHKLDICVHTHRSAYVARVPEAMKCKFFYIKVEVWNESHIVWEPFQTPIFQLYKALHGIFQEDTENPRGKHKIH